MKLVTTEEMRRVEQAAVEAGDTWEGLMDRAGKALADEVLARLQSAFGKDVKGRRVLALVGPGNNGGDALVAGRHLHDAGLQVQAYLWKREIQEKDRLIDPLKERKVPLYEANQDEGLAALRRELGRSDAVIDGLLGMGLARNVEGSLKDIIELLNQVHTPLVVAVDLPTGVQADTGQVLGVAVQAAVTVTMGLPKRGLYQFPGAGCAGEVVVADIGIPKSLFTDISVEIVDAGRLRSMLPTRPQDAHKGTLGRVLVVAGSLYYTGAPYLAAMGAYRVGAGLVTIAPPRSIYPFLAAKTIETTFFPLPEGEKGSIGENAVDLLADADVLERYQVVVLGCGLGQEDATVAFVRRLLGVRERGQAGIGFLSRAEGEETQALELPSLVLDADGLNALANIPEWWKRLRPGQAVLTPHPGEMARLMMASQEEVLASRIAVAQRAATTWRQVVVFKGAYTVIARSDGRAFLNPMANPVLATAGTGDVLAGAIGGFIAQGVPLFEAAVLGVYVHGLAGDMLCREVGAAGVVAGDVLGQLPRALRCLKEME